MTPEEALEPVLVVPLTSVLACCRAGEMFNGFRPGVSAFSSILSPTNHRFLPRGEVEQNHAWKQLIPYTIVRYKKQDQSAEPYWYLSYQRSSDQAEKRLARKHSIGIGGHVTDSDLSATSEELLVGLTKSEAAVRDKMIVKRANVADAKAAQMLLDLDPNSLLWRGMIRELFEEVELTSIVGGKIVGLVNDDSTDVGKVHLGVVIVIDVLSTSVLPKDPYVENLQWLSPSSLRVQREFYETWSQLCIEAITDNKF